MLFQSSKKLSNAYLEMSDSGNSYTTMDFCPINHGCGILVSINLGLDGSSCYAITTAFITHILVATATEVCCTATSSFP